MSDLQPHPGGNVHRCTSCGGFHGVPRAGVTSARDCPRFAPEIFDTEGRDGSYSKPYNIGDLRDAGAARRTEMNDRRIEEIEAERMRKFKKAIFSVSEERIRRIGREQKLKRAERQIWAQLAGLLICLYVLTAGLRYRIMNPELTETQLLFNIWEALTWQ